MGGLLPTAGVKYRYLSYQSISDSTPIDLGEIKTHAIVMLKQSSYNVLGFYILSNKRVEKVFCSWSDLSINYDEDTNHFSIIMSKGAFNIDVSILELQSV